MKALKILVVLAVCLMLPGLAMASKTQLVGTWKVVSVAEAGKTQPMPKGASIVMTFKADGSWTGVVTNPKGKVEKDGGTWTLAGNKLTTVDKSKKTETATVTFSGNKASFTDGSETINCVKVK